MQPNQFKYYLITGDNAQELANAPTGWAENLIKWARSANYHGMQRTLTLPMEFVTGGADYLRQQYYILYGVEARVGVRIDELNTDNWLYETRYFGSLDFSTFEDNCITVTLSAIDNGIEAKINNNDDQKYTIPLDIPEAFTIQVPGIPLKEAAQFIFPQDTGNNNADYFPNIQLVTNQHKSIYTIAADVDYFEQTDPNWGTIDKSFYYGRYDAVISMTGVLKFFAVGGSSAPVLDVSIYNQIGKKIQLWHQQVLGSGLPEQEISLNLTIPVSADERLFLYLDSSQDTSGGQGFRITFGETRLEYNVQSPATSCKVIRPFDAFKYLIKQINDGQDYPCKSYYFNNGRAKNVVMTSGDALRGFNDAGIITTFKDFFQSYYADGCIGFGVENGQAVIEDFAYFFKGQLKAATIQDEPAIKPTIQPAIKYMYDSIAVGYEDQTYDALNGREEVASTTYWKLPITRVSNEYNIVSKYRADQTGIENARSNVDGKTSADNGKGDNDVFLLKLTDLGQVETAADYGTVTGVITGAQTYNIDLWPKHMLLRHGRFLRSILDKRDGAYIRFTSGLKNYTASSNNGVSTVVENQDIEVVSLGDKIFLPHVMSIETDYPIDMLQLLDSNPTGYIEFPYNGVMWKGFNESGTVDISKSSKRTFELLLTVDNDLSKLID